MKNSDIVKIPRLELIVLKFYSLIWGLLFLIKRLTKRILLSTNQKQSFGNPPECLIDNSVGQHSYVKLKGIKFHYVEAGDKGQPLVILLHGFPDCWLSWRYQIPVLAKYFRVVALDMKGFGDSDKPKSLKGYYIERLAEEFHELVILLGYGKCVIIGHDLGALFGWYIIHLYPELVEKFIPISAPHPNLYWSTLPRTCEFNLRWVQFSQLPVLPELKALDGDLEILNRTFSHLNKTYSDEEHLDAYKYTFSRREDWTGAINYFRIFPLWRLDVHENYQLPVLLITGNKDASVRIESIILSSDYVHKFSLKVINNTSHFPHQEDPDEVNKILLNFLIGNTGPTMVQGKPSNGLVNRMFGAVSNTVKYGNSMFDVVHKRTNGLTARALSLAYDTQ